MKQHKRKEVYYHHPDFCRVDYENGLYEYLANDERIVVSQTINDEALTTYYDYRATSLLHECWKYIRIKRLNALPEGKTINTLYRREEKIL